MNAVVARVAAVVVAVGMVVGALAIRGRLDGDGPAGQVPSPDGGATVTDEPGGGAPAAGAIRVACAEDLGAVCEALAAAGDGIDVQVEPAAATVERLGGADRPDLDAWVVLDPWPEIADDVRQRAGRDRVLTAVSPLATSPLVLVVERERGAVLEGRCGAITWACVGEVSAGTWAEAGGRDTWGSPKPGHAPPTAAAGLLVTGQVAASRVGTTDFSTRELAADDFRGWFATLERAVATFTPPAGSHLRQLLQFGPGTVDVVGTLEAEPAALLPRVGPRADDLRVVHTEPLLVATLVLARVEGGPDGPLDEAAGALADALAAEGWRTTGAPPAAFPDWPVLPEPAVPLPSAGALQALWTAWEEVVR